MHCLVDAESAMTLEEYAKLVGVFTLVNADQTVMYIWLHCGIIKNALRNGVSVGGLSYTARLCSRVEAGSYE